MFQSENNYTYQRVINDYNLDILKSGADLQLSATGDLKLTRDGDLFLGNKQFNALSRLVRRWCKEPQFGDYSLGAVIQAAANNFRHHDEWATKNPPDDQQFKSIKVLANVLKREIASDGNRHSIRQNVCAAILMGLSSGSFQKLNHNFFTFANNIIEKKISCDV